MNEIDFFLKLLDIKSTIEILSMFKINTKSKNLNYLKVKLRKILRGQTSATKNGDPFNFITQQFRNEDFKNFNENEFIQTMIEMDKKNYPEYKKYLNYISFFGDQASLGIDKLNENYIKNEEIFERKLYLDSEEKIREYIEKIDEDLNMDIYTLMKIIKVCLDKEETEMFLEVNEKYKNSDLKSIYKEVVKTQDEKKKDVLKLSYSLNNYDKDDKTNKILRTDVIQGVLIRKYKELKELEIKEIKNSNDSGRLKKKNIKLKEENKDLNEKIKEINKKSKKKEQENKKLLQELEESKTSHDQEINTLKKKEKEVDLIEELLTPSELEVDKKLEMAFIVSNRYKLIGKIFPEVTIIRKDNFNIKKSEVEKLKVGNIYIQRQVMNSNEINLLEKISRELGLEINLIGCESEKELIEAISCIKKEGIVK